MSSCIACDKDRCREYRSRNIDRIREYDRKRSALPHRREARLNYRFTDNFRASHNETTRRYVKDNPAKRAAHVAVRKAIESGAMSRGCCEWCGSYPAQAHHFDYGKQLDVTWLCTEHHALVHKCDREHKRKVSNA